MKKEVEEELEERKEGEFKVRDSEKKKVQSQFRLVLGKEAVDALDDLVDFVNTGFVAGEVARADLAGYLFRNAKRLLSKGELTKIRTEFFDERKALENLIRDSEATGKLPDDIRRILKDQARLNSSDPK